MSVRRVTRTPRVARVYSSAEHRPYVTSYKANIRPYRISFKMESPSHTHTFASQKTVPGLARANS